MFIIKPEAKRKAYYKTLIFLCISCFAFLIILARVFSVEDFGQLSSLLAVLLVLSSMSIPVEAITMRYISKYRETDEQYKTGQFLRKCLFYISVIGLFLAALGLVSVKAISEYLKLTSLNYMRLVIVAAVLMLLLAVFSGLARGMKRYLEAGILWSIVVIITMVAGSVLMLCGFGLNGVLIGLASGILVADIIGYIISRYDLELNGPQNIELGRVEILEKGMPVLLLAFGIMILIGMDIILIKHYFTPQEAGIYSMAAVMTKAIFAITFLTVSAKYKALSDETEWDQVKIVSAKKALLDTAICAVAVLGLASLIAGPLRSLVFGSKYTAAAAYILPACAYSALLSLLAVKIKFSMVVGRTKLLAWSMLFGAAADIYIAARFSSDAQQLLFIAAGTAFLLIMVNVVGTILAKPSKALRV